MGRFVKGPHGIGKSHLLVNLVRMLLYGSDGKYLVTFIPDCSYFEDERSLFDVICLSFGLSPEDMEYPSEHYAYEKFIDELIRFYKIWTSSGSSSMIR